MTLNQKIEGIYEEMREIMARFDSETVKFT
jgi:hypothetical protein